METLVRQYEVSQRLAGEGAVMLTAKVHKVGGSHYIEQNLWTSFGAMPFKVMGGVIVSYSLFEGKTSQLLASQLLPLHGGFESVNAAACRDLGYTREELLALSVPDVDPSVTPESGARLWEALGGRTLQASGAAEG